LVSPKRTSLIIQPQSCWLRCLSGWRQEGRVN